MKYPTVEDSSFKDMLDELLHRKPKFTVLPKKQTNAEKEIAEIAQFILDKHFEDDKNVVSYNKAVRKKFSDYVKHYMTCTDSAHMHDVLMRWLEEKMSFRRYRHYKQGEFIVVGVDTSWGGTDYCSAQFLSKTHLDIPTVYHSKVLATEMTPLIHAELERIYDETKVKPVVAFERNNGGVAEIERLATLNRSDKYKIYQEKSGVGTTDAVDNSVRLGWTTSSATRPTMLSMLKEAVDARLLRIYDKPTITEMFSFIVSQTSSSWKAQAESGAHDDLIMALAIAWQLYQTENPPKPNTTHKREIRRSRFHV